MFLRYQLWLGIDTNDVSTRTQVPALSALSRFYASKCMTIDLPRSLTHQF
jgi:hypothetical protein